VKAPVDLFENESCARNVRSFRINGTMRTCSILHSAQDSGDQPIVYTDSRHPTMNVFAIAKRCTNGLIAIEIAF
jgi:hypothetical protein